MTRLIARTFAVFALVLAVISLVLSSAAPAMAAKEKFQRTKPHVNFGTVGQSAKQKKQKATGGLVIVPPWGTAAPHGFDDPRIELPRDIPTGSTTY